MSSLAQLFVALALLDRSPAEALRLYAFGAVSLGAHVLAALGLFLLPLTGWLDHTPDAIAIELVEPPPRAIPEPEPEPEPEEAAPEPAPPPEPEPEPVVRRPRPRAAPPPTEEPPAEEPPPAEEAIADFSGMTLTNEQGAGWQSATGSGAAIEGPIGRPGAVVTGRNRHGARGGTPGGAGSGDGEDLLVRASDLSRRPEPPASRLRDLLRRNYPRDAQNEGIDGDARVRVRVEADGRVRTLAVLSEDHAGFGAACRRTIREGGRWGAPLDRHGNAVPTIMTFRCTFTLH